MVWHLCDDKEPLTTVLNTTRSITIGGEPTAVKLYSSSTLSLEKATEWHFQLPQTSADFDYPEDGPSVSWSRALVQMRKRHLPPAGSSLTLGTQLVSGFQPLNTRWLTALPQGDYRKKEKVKSLNHVRLFTTPRTVAYQAPPSMGFSRWVLEWPAISFSRGSSRPRDPTPVSHMVGRRFTVWATREVLTVTMPGDKSTDVSGILKEALNGSHLSVLLDFLVL